jgi:hypothetical protein
MKQEPVLVGAQFEADGSCDHEMPAAAPGTIVVDAEPARLRLTTIAALS